MCSITSHLNQNNPIRATISHLHQNHHSKLCQIFAQFKSIKITFSTLSFIHILFNLKCQIVISKNIQPISNHKIKSTTLITHQIFISSNGEIIYIHQMHPHHTPGVLLHPEKYHCSYNCYALILNQQNLHLTENLLLAAYKN